MVFDIKFYELYFSSRVDNKHLDTIRYKLTSISARELLCFSFFRKITMKVEDVAVDES